MDESLVIREYQPADDESCKRLEVSASQFRPLKGLVKAAIFHLQSFNAKAAQFDQHLILVCVDSASAGAVCGVIAVAVKTVYVSGAPTRAGYVFDVRVDEKYQRRGIGSALSAAVEQRCKAAPYHVSYLYLSVNADNAKAKALYTNFGWRVASGRRLEGTLLLSEQLASPSDSAIAARGGGVRKLPPEEAIPLVSAAYTGKDLALTQQGFSVILRSDLCLGTYLATDGAGSRAALTLWHSSTFTVFKPVKIFVPVSWWVKAMPTLLAATAVGVTSAVACAAFKAATSPNIFLSSALAGAIAIGALAGWQVFKFVQWVRSRTAFRARAFAPVFEGPNWVPLMRCLLARLRNEARMAGFSFIIINGDVNDPFFECIKTPPKQPWRWPWARYQAVAREEKRKPPPVEFWHKRLDPAGTEGTEHDGSLAGLSTLGPDGFFDPRDMS